MRWLWILKEVLGIFYHNDCNDLISLQSPKRISLKAPVKDVKEADGKDILT